MKQLKSYIILFVLTCLVSSCDKPDDNSTYKHIEISTSSFEGGYPAVWFNSTSGIIKPVGAEPVVHYSGTSDFKFWIEPRDPEFTYQVDEVPGTNGIKLIGSGDEVFNSTQKSGQIIGLARYIQEADFVLSNVFYIRVGNGDCVIQITDFNQTNSVLEFKWKLL